MTVCCAAICAARLFWRAAGLHGYRLKQNLPPRRGDTEKKANIGSLLFGNDTEGRDGFVKMAGFQLNHRTNSLLILDE